VRGFEERQLKPMIKISGITLNGLKLAKRPSVKVMSAGQRRDGAKLSEKNYVCTGDDSVIVHVTGRFLSR
jgi:hypothetical protein